MVRRLCVMVSRKRPRRNGTITRIGPSALVSTDSRRRVAAPPCSRMSPARWLSGRARSAPPMPPADPAHSRAQSRFPPHDHVPAAARRERWCLRLPARRKSGSSRADRDPTWGDSRSGAWRRTRTPPRAGVGRFSRRSPRSRHTPDPQLTTTIFLVPQTASSCVATRPAPLDPRAHTGRRTPCGRSRK